MIGAGLPAAAVSQALSIPLLSCDCSFFSSQKSRKSRDPFVSLSLLTEGPFRYAIVAAFLSSSTGFGMMLVIPLMLGSMFQLTADRIGFVLSPAAMAAAPFGLVGGKWIDRFGSISMMLIAASFYDYRFYSGSS